MATYQELQAQLAELTRQADVARAAEVHAVIEDIRAKVAEYGLTEKDVFGRRRVGRQAKKTAAVAPKYRDPKTGAEWSGRGRAPAWIKDVKDRSKFLIAAASDAAASAGAVSKKAPTKKAVAKKSTSKAAAGKRAAAKHAATKAVAEKGSGRKGSGAKKMAAKTDTASVPVTATTSQSE